MGPREIIKPYQIIAEVIKRYIEKSGILDIEINKVSFDEIAEKIYSGELVYIGETIDKVSVYATNKSLLDFFSTCPIIIIQDKDGNLIHLLSLITSKT